MAGMNLILKCSRSINETAHFLNCDQLLPFHLPSSFPAGMLEAVWSHMMGDHMHGGRPSKDSEYLSRNLFVCFLRSGALDHFPATSGACD